MIPTGSDGGELPLRRVGLSEFVVAPTLDRTVNSKATRMVRAAGNRREASRRCLHLAGQRRAPAHDRTVGAQRTPVIAASGHVAELPIGHMHCPMPFETLWAGLPPAGERLIGAHRAVLPSRRGHVGELSAPLGRPTEAIAIEFPAEHRAVRSQPTPIRPREGDCSEPAGNFGLARSFDGRDIADAERSLRPALTRGLARALVNGSATVAR